jgi:hypothetical protein
MQVVKWKKSTYSSANGSCVEVAHLNDGGVLVRDSKDPDGGVLSYTAPEWDAFLKGAQAGEFDRPGA